MPEVVGEHKFGRLSRPPQYDQYLDGQIYLWNEEELEEFPKGAQTLRSGLYSAAARKGVRCRTQLIEGKGLYFQAIESEE